MNMKATSVVLIENPNVDLGITSKFVNINTFHYS